MKAEKAPKIEKYEIESWARTLQEAEEIKADDEKMKLVKPILESKFKSAKMTLEQLKERGANLPMEDDEEYHEMPDGKKMKNSEMK